MRMYSLIEFPFSFDIKDQARNVTIESRALGALKLSNEAGRFFASDFAKKSLQRSNF